MSARGILWGLILVGVILLSLSVESQARYLPTRADPARRERIREILRALLLLSPGEPEARGPYTSSYEYGTGAGDLKGLERSDWDSSST